MSSQVADHFYVSITQLLIEIDKKWTTEIWSNISSDMVIWVAFYCSLQQVSRALIEIHFLNALRSEEKGMGIMLC